MCIRDSVEFVLFELVLDKLGVETPVGHRIDHGVGNMPHTCLLYTSDAADERSSVDLGGRRIIKKKITSEVTLHTTM